MSLAHPNLDAFFDYCLVSPKTRVGDALELSPKAQLEFMAQVLNDLGVAATAKEVSLVASFLPLSPGASKIPALLPDQREGITSAQEPLPVIEVNGAFWSPCSGWGLSGLMKHHLTHAARFHARQHPFQVVCRSLHFGRGLWPPKKRNWSPPSPERAQALLHVLEQPHAPVATEAPSNPLLQGILEDVFARDYDNTVDITQAAAVLRFMGRTAGVKLDTRLRVSTQGFEDGAVRERYSLDIMVGTGRKAQCVAQWDTGVPGLEVWTSAPRPVPLTIDPTVCLDRFFTREARLFMKANPWVSSQLLAWKIERSCAPSPEEPAPRRGMRL